MAQELLCELEKNTEHEELEFLHEEGLKSLWSKRSKKARKAYLEKKETELQREYDNTKSGKKRDNVDQKLNKVRDELKRLNAK